MAEVTETKLPGVGIRHDFATSSGERLAVLAHRGGRREILVYDRADPDTCSMVLHLSVDDTRTLAELLGTSQVSQALNAMEQQIEGLAIDWVTIAGRSEMVGKSLAEAALRDRTGASVVALIRGEDTIAAPSATESLQADDVAVAVGTPEGLAQLRSLLGS
jgi:TrkA domain protein